MSIWSIDAQTVTHSIQLAVAPVFFLTAVAGMIGSVAGRLARIIDRARKLEESLRTATDHELIARSLTELHYLRERDLCHVETDPLGYVTASLTRHGVDVAEYTVAVEPGIARPAKV